MYFYHSLPPYIEWIGRQGHIYAMCRVRREAAGAATMVAGKVRCEDLME